MKCLRKTWPNFVTQQQAGQKRFRVPLSPRFRATPSAAVGNIYVPQGSPRYDQSMFRIVWWCLVVSTCNKSAKWVPQPHVWISAKQNTMCSHQPVISAAYFGSLQFVLAFFEASFGCLWNQSCDSPLLRVAPKDVEKPRDGLALRDEEFLAMCNQTCRAVRWMHPVLKKVIVQLQCEAPKIAKLVYNSNNYGLWYSYWGL